ncbi:MAG: hypothetical protein ACREKM_04895 [Longimicrobiales bacterium]
MKTVLYGALAVLALSAAACNDDGSGATAIETEALVASATDWTPSDVTAGLQVDDATRQELDAGLRAMHASMLELHRRHEVALTLEGDARVAYLDDLDSDMRVLHEQHQELWSSLDPDVRDALATRLHEQMREHDDGMMQSFHERMRRLHDASGAGH